MVSRRARCALHAVGYLAYRQSDKPVVLAEIREYLRTYSKELTFSAGHISKIFQELSHAGILRAVPGRNGGYLLARPASQVRLVEVVQALDGAPGDQCCLLSIGTCENQPNCGVYHVIQEAERMFYDFLSRESAASLAKKMFRLPPRPLRDGSPSRGPSPLPTAPAAGPTPKR